MPTQLKYYSLNQLLADFPVSRSTIYSLVENGQLPKPIKFGSRSLWLMDEVNEAMARFADARNG